MAQNIFRKHKESNRVTNHPLWDIKISNMTLDEAIQHCKEKAKEQCSCNYNCALEHKQLAIWLSDLKALTENGYSHFVHTMDNFAHDYAVAALQGRLAANPTITSKEAAKLVADDVKCLLEELALNYRYVDFVEEKFKKEK